MAKCAWCGNEVEIYKSGYCESCYERIRGDIKQKKARLNELQQLSTDPAADKDSIAAEAKQICAALDEYKRRRVPFYKTEHRSTVEQICRNVGAAAPAPLKKKLNSTVAILSVLCVALAVNVIILARSTIITAQQIDVLEGQVSSLQAENADLQSKIDAAAKTSATAKTVLLDNGNFVSGTDFAPGTYDIEAVSGCGNVMSDNSSYDGGINAIMGVKSEDALGISEQKYSNIKLPEGTTLTLDGVKVRLTLVEAY